jgi:hypothetical protein
MVNAIAQQKKGGLDAWEDAISPHTVENLLYRNMEGMDKQVRVDIKQLSKEGYMRMIKLSGPAIGIDHGENRLFIDEFIGGNYYFFMHEIEQVEELLSNMIKPNALILGQNRASLRRCLTNAGFGDEEATKIISRRLKIDREHIDVSFDIDIQRRSK